MENTGKKRNTWIFPWSYREGFYISLFLLLIGFLLELVAPVNFKLIFSWPLNIQIGIIFTTIVIFFHFVYRKSRIKKWLASVPAAISSIGLFAFLVLILGLVPQHGTGSVFSKLGLTHVKQSWPFFLSALFLMTSLGLTILKRAKSFKGKNIGFILNHFGLWLIILSGSLGSGDMQRVSMEIREGTMSRTGHTGQGEKVQLPFAIRLNDFHIKEYNPKLALINLKKKEMDKGLDNNPVMIEDGQENYTIGEYRIRVNRFYPEAIPDSAGFFSPAPGKVHAVPAAHVEISHETRLKGPVLGWVSPGNKVFHPVFTRVSSLHTLAMTLSEPKEFRSDITYFSRIDSARHAVVKVNQPVDIGPWKIYQLSYNQEMGKHSPTSVLEAIRDPWLPVVYTGIFMLMAGALYIFWLGNKTKKEKP